MSNQAIAKKSRAAAAEGSGKVFTVRLTERMRRDAERAMDGRYSNMSEYLRDLIRKDTADA